MDEEQDAPKFAAPAEKLILAVDDDDNIRNLLELIATSEGFRFASAVDGLPGESRPAPPGAAPAPPRSRRV